MSDLREALTELVGEAWDDGNAVGLDGYAGPNRGAGDVDPEAERRRGQLLDRAAETLAAEVDPEAGFARPLLDREAVRLVLMSFRDGVLRDSVRGLPGSADDRLDQTADMVVKLATPMPTIKALDVLVNDELHGEGVQVYPGTTAKVAARVLALLNGTES